MDIGWWLQWGYGCRQGQIWFRTGGIPQFFKEWLRLQGLQDVWRVCNGDKRDYTFSARHNTFSRTDYVFVLYLNG